VNKNKLHLLVDVLAYLVMLGLASSGLVLAFVLPPGTGGRHGGHKALTMLGRSRHEWGDIHWYLAIALLVLVAIHVVLHWKWVTNSIGALLRGRGERKAGAGLGGAVLLAALGVATVGLLAAPWLLPVKEQDSGGHGGGHRGGRGKSRADEPACDTCAADSPSAGKAARTATAAEPAPSHGHGKRGGHGDHNHTIRGRTTLAEAAQAAGVSVDRLLAELKLPAGTKPDERLGHLRQAHGFSMEDVRATIARLAKAAKPQ